jgi:putative transcriptional regulator
MNKSRILDEMHETMADLHQAGCIGKQTMRQFEAACLPVAVYSAPDIKGLRERLRLSQAVFAAYMNVSLSTVQKWERGDKKPGGSALRLLHVIDKNGLDVLL